jgi:acetolactate synthase-1/2/3 large subunit
MSIRSVADVFGGVLAGEGIRYIFGFPGGATVEMAERARQHGLEFVLAHSEWAAGYMAVMHGDLTGKPGVLLTTLGPGATNAINPTAMALLDRSPLVVVTGRAGRGDSSNSHQRLSQTGLYEPITKWSTTVEAPCFRRQLHRAIRLSVAERPGPVHLDLPADETKAACEDSDVGAANDAKVHRGPSACIETATARLRAARRPLVLAGYTALRHNAGCALRALAERWGIPVVTTPKAKGVLPESHAYWAGVVEMAGAHFMDEVLGSADLLLAIGVDGVEMIRRWKQRAPVIHIDPLPNTDEVYISDLDLVGDVSATLEAIADRAPGVPQWKEREVADVRREYLRRTVQVGQGLTPSQVVFAARSLVDSDAIVVCDVGSHKMLMGGLWRTEKPRTFFMSNGLGTMGFGLPAAIAAQLLAPERRVLCFTGDGGLAMVLGELGTATDRKLRVVVIVFDDGAMDRILRKQEAEGYTPLGTRFGNPDFVKLSEAYGIAGFRAGSIGQFEQALQAALAEPGPALIDAQIDPSEYGLQFRS